MNSDREREWLASLPAAVNPEVVRRTQELVRRRARQMHEKRVNAVPLWIAAALSVILTIITTPYAWTGVAWLAHVTDTRVVVWQLLFWTWWFMPVTVIGAAAAWRQASGRQI